LLATPVETLAIGHSQRRDGEMIVRRKALQACQVLDLDATHNGDADK
jgi:hypothetical protein